MLIRGRRRWLSLQPVWDSMYRLQRDCPQRCDYIRTRLYESHSIEFHGGKILPGISQFIFFEDTINGFQPGEHGLQPPSVGYDRYGQRRRCGTRCLHERLLCCCGPSSTHLHDLDDRPGSSRDSRYFSHALRPPRCRTGVHLSICAVPYTV